MNKIILLIYTLCISSTIYSQSIEEIKNNKKEYLWGEGSGVTLNEADKIALSMLISQISTTVESSTKYNVQGKDINGKETVTKELNKFINTYSDATLKNTERLVISNEPDAVVFRYIKRNEIAKVFNERKHKILSFVSNAEKDLNNLKIADALRYYYWSLVLLESHPNRGNIEFVDFNGDKHLLQSWLPRKINDIFSNLDIETTSIEKNDTYNTFYLYITYNNKPVENFDFSYWDGTNWSNLCSAKNGLGIVEMYGISRGTKSLKIKAEYLFEGETKVDRELENVFSKITHVSFRKSYFNVGMITDNASLLNKNQTKKMKSDISSVVLTEIKDNTLYQNYVDNILVTINKKNYSEARKYFTKEGFEIFTKLINYGNAKVVGDTDLQFISFEDKVICRSIPMSFNFKTNNKQFIENVVFQFNKEGKIENVNFTLSKTALDHIIRNEAWSEYDRIIIVNFLENYKTAYALKRINYIENIFADDAIIITGTVVKIKPIEDNKYKGNKIIKYNRQTKKSYIRNLKYQFNSKEYINLKFEESKIRKGGKNGKIYGIQIKQSYVSSNYGDIGYLFLMIDLNDHNMPKIEVRTWQPESELDMDSELYNLSDF